MEHDTIRYTNGLGGYLENQSPKPFYHTNLDNVLEGVSLKSLPQYERGGLETVFSDKAKTSKAGVKALLEEIALRETLDSHLINKIDDQICEQDTALMQLKNLKVDYSPELAKHVDKRRTQLEANVLELEREKRREYLECWRDLMFLKKYLLSALKDYWTAAKKRDVLSYDLHRKNENTERSRGNM